MRKKSERRAELETKKKLGWEIEDGLEKIGEIWEGLA